MSGLITEKNEPKRLVFMGSHPIALPSLNWILEKAKDRVEIVGVVTQPDRRTGRGMKLAANPIKEWATLHELPVFQPEKANADLEDDLKELGCELILVMAYGQIIAKSLIDLPELGTLNLHASLLPKLRGASPLHTAIASGLTESGVTLMRIEPKMDAGPIVDQEAVAIPTTWTTDDLTSGIAQACIPLLERNLSSWVHHDLDAKPQNTDLVNYCRILKKEDAFLDFNRSAKELYDRIRAFQPWPGTSFDCRDNELKIREATFSLEAHNKLPGTVEVIEGKQLVIYCGEGRLFPTQIQKPGSRTLPVDAFLRGFQFDEIESVQSRPMNALTSANPIRLKKADPQG